MPLPEAPGSLDQVLRICVDADTREKIARRRQTAQSRCGSDFPAPPHSPGDLALTGRAMRSLLPRSASLCRSSRHNERSLSVTPCAELCRGTIGLF